MSFQFGNNLSVAWKKLKGGDYTVKTFEAHKLWKIETVSSSIYFYDNYGIKLYRALYPENHKYFGNVANISSSLYERVFTTQSLDPKILWYYLDHNFYTEYANNKNPLEETDDNTITYLWQSSSIMSLPLGLFGEGIKKKSFTITNHSPQESPQTAWEYTLIDDGNGNLIDTVFDESNFVPKENNLLYIGFNEKYREYYYKNNKLDYVLDTSPNKNTVDINNVKLINYIPGIPTTYVTKSSGVAASFDGSYLHVKKNNKNLFNFTSGSDFSFSFWINLPSNQSVLTSDFNLLFDKKSIKNVETNEELTSTYSLSNAYPFDISVGNSNSSSPGSIFFSQKSELQSANVHSTQLTSNVWNHVVCQKTGSNYQIWLNGVLDSSTSISQQITLSGEEAKNASTTGLIFLHGPHQVAPILIITKPGFFSNKPIK